MVKIFVNILVNFKNILNIMYTNVSSLLMRTSEDCLEKLISVGRHIQKHMSKMSYTETI